MTASEKGLDLLVNDIQDDSWVKFCKGLIGKLYLGRVVIAVTDMRANSIVVTTQTSDDMCHVTLIEKSQWQSMTDHYGVNYHTSDDWGTKWVEEINEVIASPSKIYFRNGYPADVLETLLLAKVEAERTTITPEDLSMNWPERKNPFPEGFIDTDFDGQG